MAMGRWARIAALTLTLVLGMAATASAAPLEHVGQYGIGALSVFNGGLANPFGVAVGADGAVAVSDQPVNRVAFFSQTGQFRGAAGKNVSSGGGTGTEFCVTDCQAGEPGTGAGQLATPWGAATNGSEVFVADTNNARISVFDFAGHFLRAFGANVGGLGVNVCTTVCNAGTAGGASGQMFGPAGIAVDAQGQVFVSDLSSARIDVFDGASGQFIRAFGKNVGGPGVNVCTSSCVVGVADSSEGSVTSALGLAVDAQGTVYAAEAGPSRISKFSTQGTFLGVLAHPGPAAGQVLTPNGVAVGPDGTVYVADTNNLRLDVFGANGAFQRAVGYAIVPGGPFAANECTILCQSGIPVQSFGAFAEFRALATDCRGAVYTVGSNRIDKYAEPGVGTPPCPPPPAPPAPPAKPSNAFSFGKSKGSKSKGTLTIPISLPGAGSLSATAGKKFSVKVPQPTGAGIVSLTVKAAGKGLKTLGSRGKLKGTLAVTFTPTGGDASTLSLKFTLVKKVAHKAKPHGAGK